MRFEWDERKRLSNLAKHGIDFVRARELFDGRFVVTVASARGSEPRWRTTGVVAGRCITAVWTWRGDSVRLISVRRARNDEKRAHRELHERGA